MKKCVFLNLFLLLMVFNLTANSPGGKSSGKPLPKHGFSHEIFISDWGALPVKNNQPDTALVEQTTSNSEVQRFSFPDLDKQIIVVETLRN